MQLNFCGFHENKLCVLATTSFQFYNDSTYFLAWYLINSVYNNHALDDLELIIGLSDYRSDPIGYVLIT
jgi:hypothetical protein